MTPQEFAAGGWTAETVREFIGDSQVAERAAHALNVCGTVSTEELAGMGYGGLAKFRDEWLKLTAEKLATVERKL